MAKLVFDFTPATATTASIPSSSRSQDNRHPDIPIAAWKVPLFLLACSRAYADAGPILRLLLCCLIAEVPSKSYYQSGPCPAISIPWAVPGLPASPKTSAWRRIRHEEVYKADAKRYCCAFEASSHLAIEWTDYCHQGYRTTAVRSPSRQ
jgi:hypothetical protein